MPTPPSPTRSWSRTSAELGTPPELLPSNVAALMIRFRKVKPFRVASSKQRFSGSDTSPG